MRLVFCALYVMFTLCLYFYRGKRYVVHMHRLLRFCVQALKIPVLGVERKNPSSISRFDSFQGSMQPRIDGQSHGIVHQYPILCQKNSDVAQPRLQQPNATSTTLQPKDPSLPLRKTISAEFCYKIEWYSYITRTKLTFLRLQGH